MTVDRVFAFSHFIKRPDDDNNESWDKLVVFHIFGIYPVSKTKELSRRINELADGFLNEFLYCTLKDETIWSCIFKTI